MIHHSSDNCPYCNCSLVNEQEISFQARQVFDIPPMKLESTEHRAGVKICPGCKKKVVASFPANVNAPAQYGERLRATTLYLLHQHFIPEDRLADLLFDCFNVSMATDTIAAQSEQLASKLSVFEEDLINYSKAAPVKGMDETGFRIAKKTHWLHVVATLKTTWYRVHQKRKDLLDGISGTVVHDHWKSYFQLSKVKHGLCNAHHLRELKALCEIENEPWALTMAMTLRNAAKLKQDFPAGIEATAALQIERDFHKNLNQGLAYHESLPVYAPKGKGGRQAHRVGHNLLIRFSEHAEDVLRFLHDPAVPFTNNISEQAVRMMKVKQKISGGFRTQKAADNFALIRSFTETNRKQGQNILQAISSALRGKLPRLSVNSS